MLSSSHLLTSLVKHRGVSLASLTPWDGQGKNISSSGLLGLNCWFLSFHSLGLRKLCGKRAAHLGLDILCL